MGKFVVQTKTFFAEDQENLVRELADISLPIFKRQPGLIDVQLHMSLDRSHTMGIIEWERKEDHEACMASPDFTPFNEKWEELMKSGTARFELSTYEVIS
ncbi:MAG: antibiotic biosynthesis monooxygenase [Cyclobacteriaceae bacterium]|nr:antibiotic biosynthesis monooxygenase [Cyclobacteriaceae bacterium HetDA_MAG_MS6]